jgi:hypothetical protein
MVAGDGVYLDTAEGGLLLRLFLLLWRLLVLLLLHVFHFQTFRLHMNELKKKEKKLKPLLRARMGARVRGVRCA